MKRAVTARLHRTTRLGCLMLGLLLGVGHGLALAEGPLRGPAFSDPRKLASMPEEWLKRTIEYDAGAKKEKADVAITLDQQIFLMVGKQIAEYGRQKGIQIVNREGTCGISDGFLAKKSADLAGFCCAPDRSARLPGLKFYTLGVASKVFIVHPDNPVQNITVEQLRKVYQGEYSRWSEIQGMPGAPDLPLHVVGRLHCKARPGHWRLLLDTENMYSPRMKSVANIPDVVSEVMANPGAIGYETLTNIAHYTQGRAPKVLRLEGQDPRDLSAIATLRYPLYRTFELAIWEEKALRNPHVDGLVAFMLKEVETLGAEHGFVPVARMRENGWLFYGDEVVGEPGQQLADLATEERSEGGHAHH
ncbi:MAG: substrate-binding domain-containing protein [Magnetococcus sp. MYC-9]